MQVLQHRTQMFSGASENSFANVHNIKRREFPFLTPSTTSGLDHEEILEEEET